MQAFSAMKLTKFSSCLIDISVREKLKVFLSKLFKP